ncbi:MAG: hypothetical protein F2782_03230 [Actinobacteria bacterium]|uniref:Unannotated protein n=1 Tax=freshwater metagenome TaxID=449393 RepID=A0A6J7D9H4_9ZZZZ|nr:hypothetical protein [Actinomycetota bacterium]
MTDAGFVIASWLITALVLGGYALRIALRTAVARGQITLFKPAGSQAPKAPMSPKASMSGEGLDQ